MLPGILGMAALAVFTWAGAEAFRSSAATSTVTSATGLAKKKPARRDPAPLTNQELAVALTRLGFDASPLTAAGCTDEEISSLVGKARTYLSAHIQDLRDADQNWGTRRGERDRLLRLVQGGKRENAQAYAAAQTAFSAADSARQGVFSAISTATLDGLNEGKTAVLQTIHSNGMWDMPTQFLAAGREEPEWVHLRNALANQRISIAHNVDPDAGEQAFIASQSEGAVATAIANLANLAERTAAWNAAVFP
jgi:hypothetical protein